MDYPTQDIELVLPKFESSKTLSLKETLAKFGIPLVTTDLAHEALEVDEVVHEAVVKVDETGTEAAAATAVMMMRCAMISRPPPPFYVDRPFVYVIYDAKNDRILFSGNFVKPE